MSTAPENTVAADVRVPLSTHLGPIHIAVTSRDDALAIWRDVVGLTVIAETHGTLTLGAGGTPLVIVHLDATRPVVPHTTGLYHVAIHVPTRTDLARALARAMKANVRVSPTDHLVSEALYLWDRDGNGIEITFETPWRGRFVPGDDLMAVTPEGTPHSGREPIDVPGLMAELDGDPAPESPMPQGTRIGHVHVHVGNLDAAMAFYRDQLGFGGQLLSRRYGMGDVTLDYAPHIIAFNIWAGRNAPPPPEDAAGLRWFEIVIPDEIALDDMRARLTRSGSPARDIATGFETADPWGHRIKILVG